MQVFTPYPEPLKTANCLDGRRLNKQIIECRQILAAIRGESNAWKNHPVVKQYRDYVPYLQNYMDCLIAFKDNRFDDATKYSYYAMFDKPKFLTTEFCNQHKRRLFTKDDNFYSIFYRYGKSDENWYVVDGKLLKYVNGKVIKDG